MTTNWTAMDVNTFSAQDKWAYYLVAGFMTPECHSFVVCQNPEEKKKLITYGVDNIKSFLLQASTGSHAALSDSKSAQEIRCVVDYCGLLLCHCHETVPFQDLTIKEFIELTFKCIALYNSEAINVCMKQLLAFLTKFYDDKVRKKFINCAIEASIEIGECMQGGKHVVASRNSFRILPREVIAKISAGTGISTSYVLSSLITCFISENTRTIWDPSCPGVIEESWTIRQQSQLFPLATYLINNSAIMALIEDAVVLLRQLIEAGPLPIVALHAAESLVEAFGKRHCFALNSDEIRKKAADCFEAINLTLLSSTGPPISDKTDFEKLPAILSEIFLQMTSSALSMQFHPAELMLESLLYQLTLIPKDSLNDAFFVRSFTDERVKFLSTTIQNLVQSRLARYTVAREGLALVQRVSALFDIQIFLMQNFVADGEQQLDSWVQEVVTAGTSSTASWAQAVCGCSQDETEFFCKTAMLIAFHKCKNVVKKRDFVAKFMPRQNELFKWITKEDRSLTAEKHRDLVSWYFYVAAVCVLEHVQEPRGWITILSLPIAVGVDAMSPLQWTDARFWLPADDNCGMVSFKKMLKHSTYLQPIVDNYMTTITFQSFCYVNSTTDHHWVFDVLRFAIRSAEKTKIPTQLQTLAQCLPFFASRHPSYCLQLARELWKQSHHLINSIIISFIADLVCISSGKAGNGAVDCQLCCNSRAPLPVLVSSKDQKEYVNELRALLFPVVVHSNHFPPDVMQAVIRLLRSLLFHTDRMSLRRLWNVSLSLMYDNRAEIREAYIKFFTILVKDEHLEKCLAGPLRVFFHGCFSKADRNKSPICVVYSAPLMRVFIRNTKNYNNTLRFLLHKCIRPTQFSLQQFHVLWSETRSAIYELCQKDSYLMMLGLGPSELRRRFFYRRCREVVKCVVESMRLGAFDSSQSEAFDDVEMKGVLSLCMQRMCLIFDFNSVAKLAMKIKNVIVAHVLSLYAGSVRFATCVLDFLVQRYFSVCKINPNINQQLQRQELIREAFPTLIEIWTHSLNWDHVATFCHEYCELTVEEIVSRERKRCFASHVSFNAKMLMDEENSVTKVLKKVYKKIHYGKFNLTELFKFNKEGSEFLMHFYKIGHKDEMKELLTNAAKCLAIILQEVEPKFIEDNAWFILRALRVLWTAPGGAMEAYSTFVEHVNYPEDLLPRISFPISSVTLDQMMLTKYHIREARDAHAQARISSDYFNNFHRYSVNGAIRRIYVSHEILLFSAHHSLLTSLARNICSLMEYTTDDAHGNLTAKLLGRLGCYDSDEIDYGYVRWSREFHAFYDFKTNEGFLLDFLNVTEQLPSDPDSFEFCEKAMVDCASLLGAQAAQQKDDEMRIIVDSVKSYYGKSDFKGFAGPRLVKLQRLFAKSARDFFSFVEQIALFVIRDTDKELHAVRFMAHCKNVVFCTKLLPRLVLHFLYTRPESEFKELVQELMAVVQLSMNFNAKNWVFKYGAQAVFFVVDYLEFVLSRNSPEQDEKKHEKVRAFLKALFESVDEREGLPTMIACAEHACYEHRCLRWIESYATAIPRATYYHSLQKFYARVHDIFGVHGALKQLMEVEPEHIRGLILASEVHGESNAASFLYKRDPTILNTTGPQLLDDLENSFRDLVLECDDDVSRFNSLADQFESLRSLREWDKVCPSQDTEEESYTISYYSSVMAKRNWRSLSFVSRIMYYAKNRDADNVKAVITEARFKLT